MKVCVLGNTHLSHTWRAACEVAGLDVIDSTMWADITLAAQDVYDHGDLDAAKAKFDAATGQLPIVLLSQVPPGTTRAWARGRGNVFYQVDTIIVRQAVQRVLRPEQVVVGCADPSAPLPLAYQALLAAFAPAPVLQMSYESAELAKCAINYHLAAQVDLANTLSRVAIEVGADYADVAEVLSRDARIGQHTYLVPGQTNQHLDRDVDTVNDILLGNRGNGHGPAN